MSSLIDGFNEAPDFPWTQKAEGRIMHNSNLEISLLELKKKIIIASGIQCQQVKYLIIRVVMYTISWLVEGKAETLELCIK